LIFQFKHNIHHKNVFFNFDKFSHSLRAATLPQPAPQGKAKLPRKSLILRQILQTLLTALRTRVPKTEMIRPMLSFAAGMKNDGPSPAQA
jgi:hypothetical protein